MKIDCYEDNIVFMVAFHMKNEGMGKVTEPEFIRGCEALGGADTIEKWVAQIPNLRQQWQNK